MVRKLKIGRKTIHRWKQSMRTKRKSSGPRLNFSIKMTNKRQLISSKKIMKNKSNY